MIKKVRIAQCDLCGKKEKAIMVMGGRRYCTWNNPKA